MKEKLSKFISVLKKDGIFKTMHKTYKYCMANYINKINFIRRIEFKLHKKAILESVRKALENSNFSSTTKYRACFFSKKRCGAASEQVFRLVPYHLRGATRSCLLSFPMTDFRQRSARIRGIRRLVSLGTLTRFPFHRPYPHGTADTLLHIQMSETV